MGGLSAVLAAPRDEHLRFSIPRALEKGQSYRAKVEPGIRLFFGEARAPGVERRLRTVSKNTKTNAVGKSDEEACDVAFISAVVGLQQQARKDGGDGVINIRSTYRGESLASPTEYVCGAGTIMVGVTLEGTAVKLRK